MAATTRMALTAAGILMATAAAVRAEGSAEAGRDKAAQCQTCHGLDGIAAIPDAPNIGGESAIYLTRQLQAFRSGERTHEQMSIIAQGLSDQDIDDVVAWYSALKFTVTMPE